MHPAASIILFTTASGLGYGLLFVAGLFTGFTGTPTSGTFGFVALAIALGTVTVGLLSSTFHLGHPERAWRAVSQWRSSWLSREGVMALVTYVPAAYFGIGWVFYGGDFSGWQASGLLTALGALLTVICTSMIYASLKAIPRWHNRWVPVTYLLFALMSGLLWFDALMRLFGHHSSDLTAAAGVCVVVTLVVKGLYWRSTDRAAPAATMGTATGLGNGGTVRLLESPHSGPNYLLNEMGFRIDRLPGSVGPLRRDAPAALRGRNGDRGPGGAGRTDRHRHRALAVLRGSAACHGPLLRAAARQRRGLGGIHTSSETGGKHGSENPPRRDRP